MDINQENITNIKLLKVTDVNWNDITIHRAGVIPIYYDGNNKWLGLGVSKFSTNIITIGGEYEGDDFDLLSTAVREYNEEVGQNMERITEEDTYGYYALKSGYTIQILLPVNNKPEIFTPTKELYDLLWLTPGQLTVMNEKQDYIIPGSDNVKAFKFSGGLRKIVDYIASSIESGIPYNKTDATSIIRTKRLYIKPSPILITSIDKFRKDSKVPSKWNLNALVVGTNYLGVMRYDRTLYLLSTIYKDEVISALAEINFRVHVSTMNDKMNIERTAPKRFLGSIEYGINGLLYKSSNNEIQGIKNNFISNLIYIRQQDEIERISNECNLILDYELKLYGIIERNHSLFNEKRALFLNKINIINTIVSRYVDGLKYSMMKKEVSKYKTQPNSDILLVFDQIIKIGLLNNNNGIVSIFK